jgi:parvulin-like peptidyl-prolyl isomerase
MKQILPAIVATCCLLSLLESAAAQPPRPVPPSNGEAARTPPAPGTDDAAPKARLNVYETGVAVNVNRDVITKGDVWRRIPIDELAGVADDKRLRMFDQRLLGMIEEQVLLQNRARMHLSVPDVAVRTSIEADKESLGSVEAYQESLRERRMSEADHFNEKRMQIEQYIQVGTLAGRLKPVGEVLRAEHVVEPTAAEIRDFYRKNLEEQFQSPPQAKVRAIGLPISTYGDRDKTVEMARKLQSELATGADFATLARTHSATPKKDEGGDYGWLTPDTDALQPEVLAFVFGEPPPPKGTVSEPIQLARSYWLVWIEDR